MTTGDFILLFGSSVVFATAALVLPLLKEPPAKQDEPPVVVEETVKPEAGSTPAPEPKNEERVQAIKQEVDLAREDLKEIRRLLKQRSKGDGDGQGQTRN